LQDIHEVALVQETHFTSHGWHSCFKLSGYVPNGHTVIQSLLNKNCPGAHKLQLFKLLAVQPKHFGLVQVLHSLFIGTVFKGQLVTHSLLKRKELPHLVQILSVLHRTQSPLHCSHSAKELVKVPSGQAVKHFSLYLTYPVLQTTGFPGSQDLTLS
jgi:hypothetical protein